MTANTSFAYTARFPIYRGRIASMVNISAMRDGARRAKPFKCLWDTGASMTLVSPQVAEALKLDLLDESVTLCSGLGGTSRVKLRMALLHVVLGAIPLRLKVGVVEMPSSDDDIDVVLGMDLIAQGSFAISYDGGQLMFSFCYPPAPIPLDFTSMLPLLGFHPAVAEHPEADNEDPQLATDAMVNHVRAKFEAALASMKK